MVNKNCLVLLFVVIYLTSTLFSLHTATCFTCFLLLQIAQFDAYQTKWCWAILCSIEVVVVLISVFQDWTIILKLYWKYEKTVKTRTLLYSIKKNILLRLHGDTCQSYRLTESEFECPVTMLTQNHWFDPSRFAVSDLQMSNYTQNFISFTTVKNTEIARQNPQIPSWPPKFPKILGKIPSSGSAAAETPKLTFLE